MVEKYVLNFWGSATTSFAGIHAINDPMIIKKIPIFQPSDQISSSGTFPWTRLIPSLFIFLSPNIVVSCFWLWGPWWYFSQKWPVRSSLSHCSKHTTKNSQKFRSLKQVYVDKNITKYSFNFLAFAEPRHRAGRLWRPNSKSAVFLALTMLRTAIAAPALHRQQGFSFCNKARILVALNLSLVSLATE